MMQQLRYLRYLLPVALVCLLSDTVPAQTYVGDQACSGCHANHIFTGEPDFFDGYMRSGHPWKVFQTGGLDPNTDIPANELWPFTPVPPLPMIGGIPLLWLDVEYTIGNYYWKTRFIRPDGYIWTGEGDDKTQYNIATDEFVPYHVGEPFKPFNCGRCHTTGYEATGNQNGLPGLIGTWAQDGVRCEACHGPASLHVASPSTPPPGGKDCSECHYRDEQFRMPWKGGFMRHHQQAEDLSHSPHQLMSCDTCHNPHRSVVYADGGTITQCTDCHPGDASNNNYLVAAMPSVDCIDCHMPFMGKSATASNEFTGDIRGHLFQVMTDPVAAIDNVYDDGTGSLFWNQDPVTGDAMVTLDYACLGCHPTKTLQEASAFAQTVHGGAAGNQPPNVDPGGPYTGVIGEPVNFDASGTTDPDGDTLIYLWDFGDGSTPPFPSQDPTATHIYTDVGDYVAQLAVTDGVNDPVLVTVDVSITDAPVVEGDAWTMISPYTFEQITLRLEPFAGILMVEVIQPSGASSIAIGMELESAGVIFWMDVTGAIYFGNIDRTLGSMSGVAFGGPGGGGIWFAEQL